MFTKNYYVQEDDAQKIKKMYCINNNTEKWEMSEFNVNEDGYGESESYGDNDIFNIEDTMNFVVTNRRIFYITKHGELYIYDGIVTKKFNNIDTKFHDICLNDNIITLIDDLGGVNIINEHGETIKSKYFIVSSTEHFVQVENVDNKILLLTTDGKLFLVYDNEMSQIDIPILIKKINIYDYPDLYIQSLDDKLYLFNFYLYVQNKHQFDPYQLVDLNEQILFLSRDGAPCFVKNKHIVGYVDDGNIKYCYLYGEYLLENIYYVRGDGVLLIPTTNRELISKPIVDQKFYWCRNFPLILADNKPPNKIKATNSQDYKVNKSKVNN